MYRKREEYTTRYLPPFLYRLSVDDLPDAETQDKIIRARQWDSKNKIHDLAYYQYAVSNEWYDQWQKYVGWDRKRTPGQTAPPGPITISEPYASKYIEGYEWKQLVNWYGCAADYTYDRCIVDCVTPCTMNFEIGFLNGILGRIKHYVKALNISECIGYVEFQLRCILKVPQEAKTRLWYQWSEEGSKVEPVFDRSQLLKDAVCTAKGATYILALELKDANGLWPSGVPHTDSSIDLEKYYVLTKGYKLTDFPIKDISLEYIRESICNLKDSHLIHLLDVVGSNDVVSHKVKTCQRLEQEAQKSVDYYNTQLESLKEEIKRFNEEEADFLEKKDKFRSESQEFNHMKDEFESNLKHMQQVNRQRESMVTLNVGGHYYLTSIATLTSDPNTMFAKMFGGTFPLQPLEDGSYFIDRDGALFKYVLDYLRNGNINELTLPDDPARYNALCQELDYYQVKGLEYVTEKCELIQEAFGFSEGFFQDLLSDE